MSLIRRVLLAVGIWTLACSPSTSAAQVLRDPRFTWETLMVNDGMTALAFAPDGRLYVALKRGVVLTLAPNGVGGFGAPTTFLDLSGETYTESESGLLGLVLDPAFASNRYLYLLYSRATDQRVLRVTASASFTSAIAQQEVLSGLPRKQGFHKGGELAFAPNDPNALFVGIGDDGDAGLALNLDRYNGKILRIHKTTGEGLSDNPFYSGSATTIRSRVWAYGLRNPFRFLFNPSGTPSDALYLSENGDAVDRISRVRRGSSGGWNGLESSFISPPDPNHRVLYTLQPCITGITIVTGGSFGDPAFPNNPVLMISNGLAHAWGTSGIARYRMTGSNLEAISPLDGGPFFTELLFAGAVDMALGPDGALYYVTTNGGDSRGDYALARVRLASGKPPAALFSSTALRGNAPLSVSFSDASIDPDGDLAAWRWDFGDGTSSTQRSPTHVYASPGRYSLTFTVTDALGHVDWTGATVEVTREVALRLTGRVLDGNDLNGSGLTSATQLRLYDGDTGLPIALPDGSNVVAVAPGGSYSIQAMVAATTQHIVVSAGEPSNDGVMPAYVALAIATNGTIDQSLTFRLARTALSGRVRDLRGAPAVIDLGVRNGASPYAIAGGRDVLPGGAFPPTGVPHRIVSDSLGYYYVPLRNTSTAIFTFDLLADTGRASYTGDGFVAALSSGQLLTRDITVGQIAGGRACDNLSAIATTVGVDYARDIQPIWNAQCTGCHTPNALNVGGLNLQSSTTSSLIGVASAFVPGGRLVTPGSLARSVLFEKINCADPQHGTRMRPTDAMTLRDQAKVRDFILQSAPATPVPVDLKPWLLAATLLALGTRAWRTRRVRP